MQKRLKWGESKNDRDIDQLSQEISAVCNTIFLKFVVVKNGTMSDAALIEHIRALPASLKEKVAKYVADLEQELRAKKEIKERQFGALKGMFVISPDFDEPLEDFKDYM